MKKATSKIRKRKRCGDCGRLLKINKFHKDKYGKDSLYCYCKDCAKIRRKKYNQSEKGKKAYQKYRQTEAGKKVCRKAQLKFNFNITPEQYNKLFKKQKGCCALCKKSQSNFKIRLAVDHNHKTGKIRGLLCPQCNVKLEWHICNKKVIDRYLKGN